MIAIPAHLLPLQTWLAATLTTRMIYKPLRYPIDLLSIYDRACAFSVFCAAEKVGEKKNIHEGNELDEFRLNYYSEKQQSKFFSR